MKPGSYRPPLATERLAAQLLPADSYRWVKPAEMAQARRRLANAFQDAYLNEVRRLIDAREEGRRERAPS